jgi:hypothetical protein
VAQDRDPGGDRDDEATAATMQTSSSVSSAVPKAPFSGSGAPVIPTGLSMV